MNSWFCFFDVTKRLFVFVLLDRIQIDNWSKNSYIVVHKSETVPIIFCFFFQFPWVKNNNFRQKLLRSMPPILTTVFLDHNWSGIQEFLETRKVSRYICMVFCFHNCSNLLWEKNCSSDRENFWKSRLKAKYLQPFWDH